MAKSYRTDIDGLRAIAVIPVVLFHADVALFSGGYVGVDIFFVISGFLITRLLLDDLARNTFSILTFYERRIRRIFPALSLVLLTSSVVALWLFLPSELEAYGMSLLAASFFYSNYHFMFDAGYFTAPAETKALLHMWSLAVEEQFYILFPVFLYLSHRFWRRKLGAIAVVLTLMSFIYSLWIVDARPEDAFYSAPARAWELLVGATLAIFHRKNPLKPFLAELLAFWGMLAILCSVFFYTPSTAFPGLGALLPVGGAVLIIYAGSANQNAVSQLLSISGIRFFGLISYSLYLWHWPALVFYKTYSIEPPSGLEIAALLVGVVAISYLSWKFVETPFRSRRLLVRQNGLLFAGGGAMLAGLLVAAPMVLGRGLPNRFPEAVNQIVNASSDVPTLGQPTKLHTLSKLSIKGYPIGESHLSPPTFAVWGDSHGESILPGIDASARNQDLHGLFVGRGGCLPLAGAWQVRQGYENCKETAEAILTYLDEHQEIKTVILVSRWSIYAMGERFKGEKGHTVFIRDTQTKSLSLEENKRVFERSFERTMKRLVSSGKRVILVSQVPETEWNIPTAMARAKLLGREINFQPTVDDYRSRNSFVNEIMVANVNRFGITLIPPEVRMCTAHSCKVEQDGVPIYRDSNHITRAQAMRLASLFDQVLK